ncbi:MAG: ParA family protein, partial [Fusobacteriaceae bacterium]
MGIGKVYTIKVNKGGIGKSFLTVQIGAGLALDGNKVLLLTSDSQNNILDYTLSVEKVPEFKHGFKKIVSNGKGTILTLRENLDFIPLEDSKFSNEFLKKVPACIEKLKQKYDYILIDSIPTMQLDSEFVQCSDKIIIPCYCDRVTVDGVLKVIDEAGAEKVHSIIVNRYRNTATQNQFLQILSETLENTDIFFPTPISEQASIEVLLGKGKTIWESRS